MSNQEHFKFNINDFPANDNLNGLFLTQILNSSWKKKIWNTGLEWQNNDRIFILGYKNEFNPLMILFQQEPKWSV